jgi:hypothetical protein
MHGDWYPDVKLRLFRRDLGRCEGGEPHDRIVVDGTVKRLEGCLYHFTYHDIHDMVETLNKFSSITADVWIREHKPFHLWCLLLRPAFRFLRGYFLKQGFRDGLPGMIIAVTSAYGVFLKYAKLWESRGAAEEDPAG